MATTPNRRTFLKQSAVAVAIPGAFTETRGAIGKQHFICVTCGMQFAELESPPLACPICDDERQYVGWDGQKWTTLPEMQGKFKNAIREEEAGLHSIHSQPK